MADNTDPNKKENLDDNKLKPSPKPIDRKDPRKVGAGGVRFGNKKDKRTLLASYKGSSTSSSSTTYSGNITRSSELEKQEPQTVDQLSKKDEQKANADTIPSKQDKQTADSFPPTTKDIISEGSFVQPAIQKPDYSSQSSAKNNLKIDSVAEPSKRDNQDPETSSISSKKDNKIQTSQSNEHHDKFIKEYNESIGIITRTKTISEQSVNKISKASLRSGISQISESKIKEKGGNSQSDVQNKQKNDIKTLLSIKDKQKPGDNIKLVAKQSVKQVDEQDRLIETQSIGKSNKSGSAQLESILTGSTTEALESGQKPSGIMHTNRSFVNGSRKETDTGSPSEEQNKGGIVQSSVPANIGPPDGTVIKSPSIEKPILDIVGPESIIPITSGFQKDIGSPLSGQKTSGIDQLSLSPIVSGTQKRTESVTSSIKTINDRVQPSGHTTSGTEQPSRVASEAQRGTGSVSPQTKQTIIDSSQPRSIISVSSPKSTSSVQKSSGTTQPSIVTSEGQKGMESVSPSVKPSINDSVHPRSTGSSTKSPSSIQKTSGSEQSSRVTSGAQRGTESESPPTKQTTISSVQPSSISTTKEIVTLNQLIEEKKNNIVQPSPIIPIRNEIQKILGAQGISSGIKKSGVEPPKPSPVVSGTISSVSAPTKPESSITQKDAETKTLLSERGTSNVYQPRPGSAVDRLKTTEDQSTKRPSLKPYAETSKRRDPLLFERLSIVERETATSQGEPKPQSVESGTLRYPLSMSTCEERRSITPLLEAQRSEIEEPRSPRKVIVPPPRREEPPRRYNKADHDLPEETLCSILCSENCCLKCWKNVILLRALSLLWGLIEIVVGIVCSILVVSTSEDIEELYYPSDMWAGLLFLGVALIATGTLNIISICRKQKKLICVYVMVTTLLSMYWFIMSIMMVHAGLINIEQDLQGLASTRAGSSYFLIGHGVFLGFVAMFGSAFHMAGSVVVCVFYNVKFMTTMMTPPVRHNT